LKFPENFIAKNISHIMFYWNTIPKKLFEFKRVNAARCIIQIDELLCKRFYSAYILILNSFNDAASAASFAQHRRETAT
jgi:hypothetical protein